MLEEADLPALLEAIILAAGKPMTEEALLNIFEEDERPSKDALRTALKALKEDCEHRGVELIEIASGFRFQVKPKWNGWVAKLWEEKAARYSRALLETLSLIAYRQPITRGEIEDIRGVSLSSSIFKTLLDDREWIRVVGHRDVPGRPALYATTKSFLDYFGLKSLEQLPSLPEILNLEAAQLKAEQFLDQKLKIGRNISENSDNDEEISEYEEIPIEKGLSLEVEPQGYETLHTFENLEDLEVILSQPERDFDSDSVFQEKMFEKENTIEYEENLKDLMLSEQTYKISEVLDEES